MKKFSKLIKESKVEIRKVGVLTNPVDWEEIFKPVVEFVNGNIGYIFDNKTKELLNQFLDKIDDDYKDYYINDMYDGSQESFLSAFNIDVNYRDVFDCIQHVLDISGNIDEYGSWDNATYVVEMSKIKYKDLDELVGDVEDIHSKLKMLNIDYFINIRIISGTIEIGKDYAEVEKTIRDNWKTSWNDKSDNILLFNNYKSSSIEVVIYNKDTVNIKSSQSTNRTDFS